MLWNNLIIFTEVNILEMKLLKFYVFLVCFCGWCYSHTFWAYLFKKPPYLIKPNLICRNYVWITLYCSPRFCLLIYKSQQLQKIGTPFDGEERMPLWSCLVMGEDFGIFCNLAMQVLKGAIQNWTTCRANWLVLFH